MAVKLSEDTQYFTREELKRRCLRWRKFFAIVRRELESWCRNPLHLLDITSEVKFSHYTTYGWKKRLLFTPNHLVHVFLEGLMTSKYDFFCMCWCTYVIVSSINSQVDRDPYLVVGLAFCGMVQLGNWHFLTLAERSTCFFWVGSGHVVSSLFC